MAEELHKPIIRKFEKGKIHYSLIDNIYGADIYSKYAWVFLFLGNKIKKISQSNGKPNKILVDKDSKTYNRSMKSFLQNYDIEMYSTHNEGKLLKDSLGP